MLAVAYAGEQTLPGRPKGRPVIWRSQDGSRTLYYDPLDESDLLVEASYQSRHPEVPPVDFSGTKASRFTAGSMDQLCSGIAQAAQSHGRPFDRIILVGHGGGRFRLPGVLLRRGERFEARTLTGDHAEQIRQALKKDGALIIGSCGHRLEYPGGAGKWDDSLQELADNLQRSVCASPNIAFLSLREGVTCQVDPRLNPDGVMTCCEPK
jgi:hypothetical protein